MDRLERAKDEYYSKKEFKTIECRKCEGPGVQINEDDEEKDCDKCDGFGEHPVEDL